jgi:hypothetical protein
MKIDKVRLCAIGAVVFLALAVEQRATGDGLAPYSFGAGVIWVGLTFLQWRRDRA